MNKYMEDMPCPHGWKKCFDCMNERLCRAGLYHPDKTIIEIAAEISEKVMHKEVVESIREIKKRNAVAAYTDLDRFYSFRVQGLHHTEVNPLDGPSAPGGGGVKRRKQPVKKQPEYLKTFGM